MDSMDNQFGRIDRIGWKVFVGAKYFKLILRSALYAILWRLALEQLAFDWSKKCTMGVCRLYLDKSKLNDLIPQVALRLIDDFLWLYLVFLSDSEE